MNTFYVNLSVKKYSGNINKYLTYRYDGDQSLNRGALVSVPFRTSSSLAVVTESEVILPKNLHKNIKAIKKVLPHPPLPTSYLELASWMGLYWSASAQAVWQTMLPANLAQKSREVLDETHRSNLAKHLPPILNLQQKTALRSITDESDAKFLLHGVTGSGKTELYARVAQQTFASDKTSLILVPEISLTPQMTNYFQKIFGRTVIITHSKLSPKKRRDIWIKVLTSSEPLIVIGPRSALFLPYRNLGLIVVDEEHETSYKQSTSPRYHGVTVAAKLAQLHRAQLILGSATPSVTTTWLTEKNKLKKLDLTNRVNDLPLPEVEIVKLQPNDSVVSHTLLLAIEQTIKARKQAILFLNRRGSASANLCTNCSHVIRCPRCESVMSFHESITKLICHSCNMRLTPPAQCPNCGHNDTMIFTGSGTQKVEREIIKHFPDCNIARVDSDTSGSRDPFVFYEQMEKGEIDIVIGTQMIAKGLHLPNVNLVGVILADSMLYSPDFLAYERTFQLITQVIGRTGRTKQSRGKAIIQTYLPNHPIIEAAVAHDYQSFYQQELVNRRTYQYPPFWYLLKVSTARKNSRLALTHASSLQQKLTSQYRGLVVLGPSQPMHPKSSSGFIWQLIIKSKNRNILQNIANDLDGNWTIDLDPITII